MSSVPIRWGGMHFDSGGLVFNSNISFDPNEQTIACYILPENSSLHGNFFDAQQIIYIMNVVGVGRIWIPPNNATPQIGSTVYAGAWYSVDVQYKPYDTFLVVQVISNETLYVYIAKNGDVLSSSSTAIGEISSVTDQSVYLGCWPDGKRLFQGTIYAAMQWKKALTEDDINEISNLCVCCNEDNLPYKDDMIFGCIFDRLKYGDRPYDFINDVYGEPVDPNHPPRWKLRLVKDMEG